KNKFFSNGKTLYVNASADFMHEDNMSEDLILQGFEISGNIRDGAEWHTNDLPFINAGGLTIKENEIVNMSPGTVIKMSSGSFVDVHGSLIINGDKTNLVYFTSIKDDEVFGDTNVDSTSSFSTPTDWNGITFYSGSVGDISNAVIKYSGGYTGLNEGSGRSAIFNLGGIVALNKTSFSDNYQSDIYQNAGSLVASSTDFFNTQYGIIFTGGTGVVSNSKFYTSTNAIDNQSLEVVDARNNWWGSEAGPTIWTNSGGDGARINGLVLFTPWLNKDPLAPIPRNPVIIVPGILSSRLFSENDEIWPNTLLLSLSIDDSYLDGLILSDSGDGGNAINASSVIKNLGSHDFFNGLFSTLESSGYLEGEDLFEYPYDWRLDIDILSLKLKEKIEEIKLQTGAEKVDLIAHSMGGLLVKSLLKNYGGESVGNFVDIATPHLGSPKGFKIINYGDNLDASIFFGLFGLNSERVKKISQNMPSIYQLLPSREYFDDSNSNY
ncbi:alpha/beta hydrolase, partial [Candidatus Parcubacteria bacterium]|nr:alpha/beta hydrolase [Candidatus Parcubacteria bacterium]